MLSDYNIYKSEMDNCNDKGQQKVKKYSVMRNLYYTWSKIILFEGGFTFVKNVYYKF